MSKNGYTEGVRKDVHFSSLGLEGLQERCQFPYKIPIYQTIKEKKFRMAGRAPNMRKSKLTNTQQLRKVHLNHRRQQENNWLFGL